MQSVQIPEPAISRFFFSDSRMAWLWLVVRLYVGYAWLTAGIAKLGNPVWTGERSGTAVRGFLNGALAKTTGDHPDVTGWYASFIQNVGIPNAETISYIVVYGEIVVGVLLILGLFTGIAAFLGIAFNFNFLFAGTVSSNPVLLFLQLFLVLAWRIAGWIGLDRYALPKFGTPWYPGTIFKK
jgi:thiosulfate dehydrogenase (quinone) large subunit